MRKSAWASEKEVGREGNKFPYSILSPVTGLRLFTTPKARIVHSVPSFTKDSELLLGSEIQPQNMFEIMQINT